MTFSVWSLLQEKTSEPSCRSVSRRNTVLNQWNYKEEAQIWSEILRHCTFRKLYHRNTESAVGQMIRSERKPSSKSVQKVKLVSFCPFICSKSNYYEFGKRADNKRPSLVSSSVPAVCPDHVQTASRPRPDQTGPQSQKRHCPSLKRTFPETTPGSP